MYVTQKTSICLTFGNSLTVEVIVQELKELVVLLG